MRRLAAVLAAALTTAALALIPTGTASADAVVLAGTVTGHYCHGGNCSLGEATYKVTIRQYRNVANEVLGTEAECSIHDVRGITSVQVDSCRLGVVGGVRLASGGPDNHPTDAVVVAPNPPNYVSTQHLSGEPSSRFDIKSVGNFSIRWSDGQLATPGDVSSLQSNDYHCYLNGCALLTLQA